MSAVAIRFIAARQRVKEFGRGGDLETSFLKTATLAVAWISVSTPLPPPNGVVVAAWAGISYPS